MDREDILNKVFESDDEGTHDHEADMARSQLLRMAEKSIKLLKMIKPGDNLEGWTAAKITKASDYIDSVFNYMDYEMAKARSQESIRQAIDTPEDDYLESLAVKYKDALSPQEKLQRMLDKDAKAKALQDIQKDPEQMKIVGRDRWLQRKHKLDTTGK